MRVFFKFIFLLCFSQNIFSQDSIRFLTPSPDFNKSRFVSVVALEVAGYGGSLALLSSAWYNEYNQTSFHFFDDSREWLQVDKAGHITTSWYLGRIGINMMEWSGVEAKKAIWYGTAGSFLYLTGIEMLDGFSDGWGFSWGDFSANVIGTGFIIGQKFLQHSNLNSCLIRGIGAASLKFSFYQTAYPKYRPNLLGTTRLENILKDYNGQSYWLSLNFSSFMKEEIKFPKWLNIAFGYGAEGMISGMPGFVYADSQGTIEFERYRQYYLSLDIDLTRIKTKSHFLKTVFEVISFIKIPAPAFEFSKKGMKLHPLHY